MILVGAVGRGRRKGGKKGWARALTGVFRMSWGKRLKKKGGGIEGWGLDGRKIVAEDVRTVGREVLVRGDAVCVVEGWNGPVPAWVRGFRVLGRDMVVGEFGHVAGKL